MLFCCCTMSTKICVILLLVFASTILSQERNMIDTPEHHCIACICHVKTACFSLKECAKYTIDYDYWVTANLTSTKTFDNYDKCMDDDNCILNTIYLFGQALGEEDCYCDDDYDCRDMISAHIYRENCLPLNESHLEVRFNNCARRRGLKQLNQNVECLNFNDPDIQKLPIYYSDSNSGDIVVPAAANDGS